MSNKYLLLLIAIPLSILFHSCSFFQSCTIGEGDIIEKEISLNDFNKIEIYGSYNIFLNQGEEQNVVIKTHSNLVDLINTKVKREKWKVDFTPCVESNESIEIYITIPDLNSIAINGSGTVEGQNQFKVNKLAIEINGSGSMDMDLEAKELVSKIKGSGDLNLSGKTKKHKIAVDGSGDVNAYDLESAESDIEINGSGDVKVDVSYSLNAKVNGSGDVYYKGNVKEINSRIDGSGKLKQAN